MNIRPSKNKRIIKFFLVFVAIAILYGTGLFFLSANFEALKTYDKINQVENQLSSEMAAFAKKKHPIFISLPGTDKIKAIVEDYSQPQSLWAIVSKTHPIPISYIPDPIVIPDVATRLDKSVDERSVRLVIKKFVEDLFAAANNAGFQLMIGSGYRSADLQSLYFNSAAASVGATAANQSIARLGESEHQTGLAIDISTVSRNCYLDTCFATTNDGQWLYNNAYKYGFILRYPKGKESITGYQYEPWHFRYVGIDLATAIHQSGLTLDEAWAYLKAADDTLRSNGAI